jgi:hypothetical protein
MIAGPAVLVLAALVLVALAGVDGDAGADGDAGVVALALGVALADDGREADSPGVQPPARLTAIAQVGASQREDLMGRPLPRAARVVDGT